MPSGYIAPALLEPKTPDRSISQIVGPNGLPITTHDPTVEYDVPAGYPGFYAGYFQGPGTFGTNSTGDATAPSGTLAGDLLIAGKTTSGATGYTEFDYDPFLMHWHWRTATGDANDNIPQSQCGAGCLIYGWRDGPLYSSGLFYCNEIGGTINQSQLDMEWGPHNSLYGSSKGLIMLYGGSKSVSPQQMIELNSAGNFNEDVIAGSITGTTAFIWGNNQYPSDQNLAGFTGFVNPQVVATCKSNYCALFINKL